MLSKAKSSWLFSVNVTPPLLPNLYLQHEKAVCHEREREAFLTSILLSNYRPKWNIASELFYGWHLKANTLFSLTFTKAMATRSGLWLCSRSISPLFWLIYPIWQLFQRNRGAPLPKNCKPNELNTVLIMWPDCSAVAQLHHSGQMVTNTGQAFPGHLSAEGQLPLCRLPASFEGPEKGHCGPNVWRDPYWDICYSI